MSLEMTIAMRSVDPAAFCGLTSAPRARRRQTSRGWQSKAAPCRRRLPSQMEGEPTERAPWVRRAEMTPEVAFALGNEERSEAAGVRGLEIDGGR